MHRGRVAAQMWLQRERRGGHGVWAGHRTRHENVPRERGIGSVPDRAAATTPGWVGMQQAGNRCLLPNPRGSGMEAPVAHAPAVPAPKKIRHACAHELTV
jgi:hypothetical protein